MRSIFSPKSRLSVSRPLAMCMNTLNVLAPTLLLVAVALMVTAKFGDHSMDIRTLLIHYATAMVAAAFVIRIIWGITLRSLRKRSRERTNDKGPKHE